MVLFTIVRYLSQKETSLFISPIQQLTSKQRAAIATGIVTLASSREVGLQLCTSESKLPDQLARILIDASRGVITQPIIQITREEMATIFRFLFEDGALCIKSRWQRLSAQNTIAAIIREEIEAKRIVLAFMHQTIVTEGGEIPLHTILSASQWKTMRNRP